jgi:prepilin signal peptidase PulO-like enzyme (type II secretory pathway)
MFLDPQFALIPHLVAGVALFLFFLLLVLITRGKGMGLGDVKYAFFMGFFLGWPKTLIGFYTAFLTGALVSLILMIGGKKKMKSIIPFGPFLVLATVVSAWWGDGLWMVFMRIIGI